jgi:hypothetical protein
VVREDSCPLCQPTSAGGAVSLSQRGLVPIYFGSGVFTPIAGPCAASILPGVPSCSAPPGCLQRTRPPSPRRRAHSTLVQFRHLDSLSSVPYSCSRYSRAAPSGHPRRRRSWPQHVERRARCSQGLGPLQLAGPTNCVSQSVSAHCSPQGNPGAPSVACRRFHQWCLLRLGDVGPVSSPSPQRASQRFPAEGSMRGAPAAAPGTRQPWDAALSIA